MATIVLSSSSATPTLQRLNSRDMLVLPGDEEAQAMGQKTQHHEHNEHDWLAPPLAPRLLEPERHSKGVDMSKLLHRIECIEIADVVKHDGHNTNYYVINVYLKHEQSRIPTNQLHSRPLLHRGQHPHHASHQCEVHHTKTPDYTVERRFSDFEKFRKNLWEVVQHPHRHYCSFCDGFMFMLLFTSAQPGMLMKTVVRSTDVRAKILDKFLHNLVGEFQLNRPKCRFSCHALTHLPIVLGNFLFGTDVDADADCDALSTRSSETSNPAESP